MTELQFYFWLDPGAKNKKKAKYEPIMKVLNQELDSRLDWKIAETFQGSYKLKCDHLLDVHYTLN